jgi:zinc/manganese transport system permease protein
VAGLLLSYHADVPAGPAIVLSAGALWAAGLLAGPRESFRARVWRPHYRG